MQHEERQTFLAFFLLDRRLQLVLFNGEYSLHLVLANKSEHGQSAQSAAHLAARIGTADNSDDRNDCLDSFGTCRSVGSLERADRQAIGRQRISKVANLRRWRRDRQAEIVLFPVEQRNLGLGTDLFCSVPLQSRLHHFERSWGKCSTREKRRSLQSTCKDKHSPLLMRDDLRV